MTVILTRILVVYASISTVMKIMGKRQVGELDVSELISALLLSEVVAMPISNPDLPLSYALIPLAVIVCFEIIITFLKNKMLFLKKIFENRPTMLIQRGELDQKALADMRISIEELIGELRILGASDISEIDYAILEQNGKLSIKFKRNYEQLRLIDISGDADTSNCEEGIAHPIIVDGKINKSTLRDMGKKDTWAEKIINEHGLNTKDIFLLTINDQNKVHIILKDKKSK